MQRRKGRRRLQIGKALAAAGLAAAACVEAPTEPSPAPLLEGNYVLMIGASGVCALPTENYQWAVEARTVGSGAGSTARVTLPPGDDTIDINLTYTIDASSNESVATADVVRGPLTTRRAGFGSSLMVTIESSAQGMVTDAGGRGEVTSGTFNGTIALTNEPNQPSDSLGSCTAVDHTWALLAG